MNINLLISIANAINFIMRDGDDVPIWAQMIVNASDDEILWAVRLAIPELISDLKKLEEKLHENANL